MNAARGPAAPTLLFSAHAAHAAHAARPTPLLP